MVKFYTICGLALSLMLSGCCANCRLNHRDPCQGSACQRTIVVIDPPACPPVTQQPVNIVHLIPPCPNC